MFRTIVVATAVGLSLIALTSSGSAQQRSAAPAAAPAATPAASIASRKALLDQYCVNCPQRRRQNRRHFVRKNRSEPFG
jgi:hypothetical protein